MEGWPRLFGFDAVEAFEVHCAGRHGIVSMIFLSCVTDEELPIYVHVYRWSCVVDTGRYFLGDWSCLGLNVF
jgi:hypothetical protein